MPRPVEVKINQTGNALSGIQSIAGGLAGLGTAAVAASAVAVAAIAGIAAAGIKTGLEFNATLEQMEISFRTLARSQLPVGASMEEINALGAEMMDWVKEISISTPFETMDLAKNLRLLIGMGVPLEQAKDLILDLGDATSAMGGNAAMFETIARAMAQISAKGKVSTEELMQLAEAGIPAFEILQEKLGVTREELDELLRGGLIPAQEGIDALSQGMEERFGGAMEEQSKTVKGLLSSLEDLKNFALAGITAPLFEMIGPGLQEAVDFFQSDQFQAMTDALGQELAEALTIIMPLLQNIAGPIMTSMEALMPTIVSTWESFKELMADPQMQSNMTALGQVIGIILIGWVKLIEFIVKEVLPRILHFDDTMKKVGDTLYQLGVIISYPFIMGFRAVKEFVIKLAVELAMVPVTIRMKIEEAIDYVKSLPARMIILGKNIIQGLIDGLNAKLQELLNLAASIAQQIQDKISDAFDMHSPSKVTEKMGEMVSQGFYDGMQEKADRLNKQTNYGNFMPTIQINNPMVRNETDITRLAKQVQLEITRQNDVYRGGYASQTI